MLDPNIPDSKIFTELYVTKKGEYDFLEIGTRSDYHNSAYLYQETNFKDIGGGLMTFERKYARIPDSSYTVQTVSVPVGRLIAMSQQTPPLTSQGYSYLGGEISYRISGDGCRRRKWDKESLRQQLS